MHIIVIALYVLSMTGILLYCLLQLCLTFSYLKSKRSITPLPNPDDTFTPFVTVQLPVFNEKYVIERLIKSVIAFNYPKESYEIQILDDSDDETTAIAAELASKFSAEGYNIHHIMRSTRTGYKAGALEYGLQLAKGEFIAIFDADFIPDPTFLSATVSFFKDPQIGVVQSRWEHLNKNYSILTQIQAFAIDVHFSVEQQGRNAAGYFINFNGTAGIWRRSAIIDAGGWSAETLTEDLDLSYRAQMKGWKFKYLENLLSPAELPSEMLGYKSQQFRWNKGGAETAVKILPVLLRQNLPSSIKLHAFGHLLNSSVYLLVLAAILLSIPVLYFVEQYFLQDIFVYLSIFFLATIATAFVFFIALYSTIINKKNAILYYILFFPVFLSVNMGLSLHNAMAVAKGLAGFKTPFIRTPKFNILNGSDRWQEKTYSFRKIEILTGLEAILGLYFLYGIYLGITTDNYGMMPVHILASIGFLTVFYYSVKHAITAKK